MLASGSTMTGAASTIVRDSLQAIVVLVSNEDGKVASSSSWSLNNLQGGIVGGATTITDTDLAPQKQNKIEQERFLIQSIKHRGWLLSWCYWFNTKSNE